MSGAVDLSGEWIGFYNYDFPCPPTQFEAVLRDSGGLISGVTIETFEGPDGRGTVLHAVIDGRREGPILRFTKIYDDLELTPEPVFYEGSVLPGGDEIEGTWSIHGDGSGSFMMMRKSGKKAAQTLKMEDKVPAGR